MKLAQTETNETDNTVTVTTGTVSNENTNTNTNGGGKKKKKQQESATSQEASQHSTDNANTTTATVTLPNVSGLTQNVDLRNPSWDVFLIGFFVVGALLYGMSLGKDRIIAMMMSIYMALAITAALPDFVLNVQVNPGSTVQITTFFTAFVVIFFLLSRWAVLKSVSMTERGSILQVVTFSVLHVGMLVAVTFSLLPPNMLARFSEASLFIFTNQWMYFAWIVAPIVAMIFLGKRSDG